MTVLDDETKAAIVRMRAHLACDPLDRTLDPYRNDHDQYTIDLFLLRNQCLKDHADEVPRDCADS